MAQRGVEQTTVRIIGAPSGHLPYFCQLGQVLFNFWRKKKTKGGCGGVIQVSIQILESTSSFSHTLNKNVYIVFTCIQQLQHKSQITLVNKTKSGFFLLHIQRLCYEVSLCPTRQMIHKLYRELEWTRLLVLILLLGNDDNIYRPCKLW